jgi:predicted DCC family thiol-disulfide oxidoreductase YuxK
MARNAALAQQTLIYDGDCAFCTLWVGRLQSWLPAFPQTLTSQSIALDDYALTDTDVERYAWYITPTHQYAGHLAFSALLRAQPKLMYRILGVLVATPPVSWIAGLTYSFVARNRHALPGGTAACDPGLPKT